MSVPTQHRNHPALIPAPSRRAVPLADAKQLSGQGVAHGLLNRYPVFPRAATCKGVITGGLPRAYCRFSENRVQGDGVLAAGFFFVLHQALSKIVALMKSRFFVQKSMYALVRESRAGTERA